MPEVIELQRIEAVTVVRMNRPERRNALSPTVLEELAQAIGDLDAEEGVRCIVITGTDEVFAAGAEVDFAWPDVKLAIETDGYETHGTRGAFESDRRLDQLLAIAGWERARFTWRQVGRDETADTLASLYYERGQSASVSR